MVLLTDAPHIVASDVPSEALLKMCWFLIAVIALAAIVFCLIGYLEGRSPGWLHACKNAVGTFVCGTFVGVFVKDCFKRIQAYRFGLENDSLLENACPERSP